MANLKTVQQIRAHFIAHPHIAVLQPTSNKAYEVWSRDENRKPAERMATYSLAELKSWARQF
jgi:hypothetical protein